MYEDEYKGKRLCGPTERQTHRHTLKWFYICPMLRIALDRQLCMPTCLFVRLPSRLELTSWKSVNINIKNRIQVLFTYTLFQ